MGLGRIWGGKSTYGMWRDYDFIDARHECEDGGVRDQDHGYALGC